MSVLAWVFLIASVASGSEPETAQTEGQQAWTQVCEDWDDWDKPGPPFRISGNTYYVGTCGIGAILITGSEGHILIDGGTEAGGELIAANIKALGFDLADIEILLLSHEHFDHVAGLAGLQQKSGGRLLASPDAALVLSSGEDAPSDPQYGMHDPFPAVRVDGTVVDGEIVRLGEIAVTAIATPGHTAGAMSWQWESCEAGKCETVVYADSMSPVSAPGYRFSDHPAYLEAYRRAVTTVSDLECTLLLTPHPSASDMRDRLLQGNLSDPDACKGYASRIGQRLEKRLQDESAKN